MSEMTMKMMIEQAETDLLHTYNRYQVVLDHGEGVYLYDVEGKKYLDFMSGIGVFALGYGNEYYNNALKEQVEKILHTSNYFYNVPAIPARRRLKARSRRRSNTLISRTALRTTRWWLSSTPSMDAPTAPFR